LAAVALALPFAMPLPLAFALALVLAFERTPLLSLVASGWLVALLPAIAKEWVNLQAWRCAREQAALDKPTRDAGKLYPES
jgi:hypothetical protein